MNLSQFLDVFSRTAAGTVLQEGKSSFQDCVTGHYSFPAKGASYTALPMDLDLGLQKGLEKNGIRCLYKHQAEAFQSAFSERKNVICVTPTNSGKSLTYILPIFQNKLANPDSRSLLLYPTKALSQDQQSTVNHLNESCETNLSVYTFDGDTSPAARKRIREAGDIVITNPDMLHSGILPHHTNWIKLFENLHFIVIDEIHHYRGIFGSHTANVLRRLLRICAFYGSDPQILACSATIANPAEHAHRLTGKSFHLITKDGAPHSQKDIIFYNPPVVQKAMGLRKSAVEEAAKLGTALIKNRISTIFFCRSRLRVELLASALKERCPRLKDKIRSYRGGYLPNERRQIEKELRTGQLLGIVSTNALELGIDIGSLDVSISVGYPGSVSSLIQQFGRAGRSDRSSLSILIASSSGADQYLIQNPKYFFEKHPEHALCNPENLLILTDHIKCAAFELPFSQEEKFAGSTQTHEILEYLADERILHYKKSKYHWMEDIYPASSFSLRSGPRENFAIIDITEKTKEEVIGETDIFSAPVRLHEGAVYIHQGRQYYVEEFLWEDRQARVRQITTDYYTDAEEKVEMSILSDSSLSSQRKKEELLFYQVYQGELAIRMKAVMFKKLKLETHENLGWGEIHTPEIEMHTQASWLCVTQDHPIYKEIPPSQLGTVLHGAASALSIAAPLFVLCDPKDIRLRAEVRAKTFRLPTIYCYDNFPGGLELASRIFQQLDQVAASAQEVIAGCPCKKGCPSCVGLPEKSLALKKWSSVFLQSLRASQKGVRHAALHKSML